MKLQAAVQYTVRGVPPSVDRVLRKRARGEGRSLNEFLVKALENAAGAAEPLTYDDLDELIGSWQEDPEFDAAMEAHESIDPDLWK